MMKTSFAQRRGFGLMDGSPRVPTGWHRILVGATAASLLLISATSHAQKYTVTDLGANTTAVAINNAGQVLGRMATSTGAGFVWTNGTSQVLPANFTPTAINTSGAITGGIMSSAGTVHVGLYANGVLTDLGVLVPPGGDTSAASSEGFGINDKGQITGGLFTGLNLNVSGSYGAFLYGPDATTYLTTNGGWGVSVNTSGQVAVTSYDCANQCWAGSGLIWSNGSNTIIGIGNLAEPAAINNAGEVTGCIVAAHEAVTSCISAFLYVPTSGAGAVTSIGPSDAFVSSGAAINNLGQVTGTFSGPGTASALTSSNTNPNSYHAFLYTPQSVQFANCITPGAAGANGYTAAVDLNALLQNTSSVTFTAGVGINDSGQILANGLDSDNVPHAYLLSPVPGVAPLITTYAGGANWQGSPPLSIGTDSRHVTRGPDGSMYVLDQGFYNISGSYVYRIDPASHTLTRVAGSGVPGYAGDGCPAANASFNAPEGLAFDAQGNLYIADTYNDTVRLVTADPAFQPNNPGALPGGPITENSLVTTLAITFPGADGTAQSITNPVALKMDPSGRYLYVAAATGVQVNGIVRVDTTTIAIPTKGSAAANQVQSNSVSPAVTAATGTAILGNCVLAACVGVPANGVSEPAANANLNVVALAPDGAGNLYAAISDGLMSINASGQLNWVAQNAAGNTVGCPVSEPFSKANLIIGDMAFDAQGNLIIGDTYSDLVCRVNLETSTIAPVAGLGSLTNVSEASIGTPCCGDGGPAINAGFSGAVYGVALDAAGDIYVANSFRVREIVVDQTSGLIDATSLIETAAGGGSFGNPSSGDGNPATSATLDNVNGVATDSEGNLYIADAGLIRRVDVSSRVISSVAGAYAPGCAANPQAALCNIGYTIAVTVDASGNVVFADSDSRIWRIENGNLVPWVSSGLNSPSALAVDSAGNLYIADSGDGMIKMASAGGGLTTIAGNGTQPSVPCSNSVCPGDGGLALQVPLSKPMGIAIDGSGSLYFTDSNAVRLIRNISSCVSNSSCSVSTIYVFPPADINGVMFPASGSFCDAPPAAPYGTYCVHEPMGIARDAAGNLFVADARYYNAVIELTAEAGNTSFSESVVTWPGAAHIVRGSAQPEPFYFWYGGDGGAPINARIDDPVGVAVDTLGNLYIADYGDNRVRLITGVATPKVTAATQTISFGAIAAQTVGTTLALQATASSGLTVIFASSTSGVCSVSNSTVTFVSTGLCTITASQPGVTGQYSAAMPVSQSFTVMPMAQTITFDALASQSAGTSLALHASASSGLPVTFTSSTTGVCTVSGSSASLVTTGTCTITASQIGNASYSAASPVSQSFTVTVKLTSDTVMLGIASGTQTYPAYNSFAIGPSSSGSNVPTGKVTLYDNGKALVTLTLGSNGVAYYTATPLGVGMNVMTASYSGDAHYAAGVSAPVTLNVTPAPVHLTGSCWGGTPYKVAYQCVVTASSVTATPPTGNITYSLDGASGSSVVLSNGSASFTVGNLPAAGAHRLTIAYAGQGNYAAGTALTESFNTAPGQTLLLINPSSYYVAAGSPITLTVAASTPQSGVPAGSVTFYDNGAALGTATIGSNGLAIYPVTSIPKGSNTYTAKYAATANYAAATSVGATVTAH